MIEEYTLRAYNAATDEGYLITCWVAEVLRSPTYLPLMETLGNINCFRLIAPHVRSLLSTEGLIIPIVTPKDKPNVICAFAVSQGPVLYGLHVKGHFRNQRLMTDLLGMLDFPRGSRIICASDTRDMRAIQAKGLYDIALRNDLLLIEGPK